MWRRPFYNNFLCGRTNKIPFCGRNVELPHSDYYSYRWMRRNMGKNLMGWHEPSLTLFFEVISSRHDVFLDVGAHLGYYSVLFSSLDGKTAIAVEPFPENLCRLNHVQSCLSKERSFMVCGCAIYDQAGHFPISIGRTSPSTARLFGGNGGAIGHKVNVETKTLADLVDELDTPPDLIKIDVEGAEGRILASSVDLLNRFQPTLIIEIHTSALNMFASLGYSATLNMLESANYEIYAFERYRARRPTCLIPAPVEPAASNFEIVALQPDRRALVDQYNQRVAELCP